MKHNVLNNNVRKNCGKSNSFLIINARLLYDMCCTSNSMQRNCFQEKKGKIENMSKSGAELRGHFSYERYQKIVKYFLYQIMSIWLTFSANNVLIHCVDITEILSYIRESTVFTKQGYKLLKSQFHEIFFWEEKISRFCTLCNSIAIVKGHFPSKESKSQNFV